MSRPGSAEMLVPAYGSSTISDLMPSIGSHLGVPGCDVDRLGVPDSQRYVVLLVDGLGWHLVRSAARDAPYLAGLMASAKPITAGVPSTTVTSLTSLGTGLVPGRHGMVGYTARMPQTNELLNALTWESALDPREMQPKRTFFERAAEAGVAVTAVAPQRFRTSGLTSAALRGPAFVGFDREDAFDHRTSLVAKAATEGDQSLVYAYERELDHTGHVKGCTSSEWLWHLSRIDDMCARLRAQLPADVTLIVTGDHGMLDVPRAHRIVVEDEPELLVGVDAFAGEGRFRQLYVDHEDPRTVADRWADRLGELAWVRTRDEAIADGWFGAVDADLAPRYGDVLVAMRSDWAVMTSTLPRELQLVGMHGSLTPAEMTVPLFCD